MVYSLFVRVPEAYASRPDLKLQQEKVYYMYEDYIGRPGLMIGEFRGRSSGDSIFN